MNTNNSKATQALINTLNESQQKALKEVLNSRRIIVGQGKGQTMVSRKIIKARSRKK